MFLNFISYFIHANKLQKGGWKMMKKQARKKAERRITLKDVTAWRVLEEEGGARVVMAVCAGKERAWVRVERSAILDRIGAPPGKGLYASRTFVRGDVIGRFEGETLFRAVTKQEVEDYTAALKNKSDRLMIVRRRGGYELLEASNGLHAPFLDMINDPRGTALRPNVMLTDSGNVVVIQATIPALDASMGADSYVRSELRMSYGEEYWQ